MERPRSRYFYGSVRNSVVSLKINSRRNRERCRWRNKQKQKQSCTRNKHQSRHGFGSRTRIRFQTVRQLSSRVTTRARIGSLITRLVITSLTFVVIRHPARSNRAAQLSVVSFCGHNAMRKDATGFQKASDVTTSFSNIKSIPNKTHTRTLVIIILI